jgi:hypothetical protein
MHLSCTAWILTASVAAASCVGQTSALPTGPSVANTGATAAAEATDPKSGLGPADRVVIGSVGPIAPDTPICFAERFPCSVYRFSLPHEGSIRVVLTWEGNPRALFVQLYWAGEGLAHEDVAPPSGPSHIVFLRPRMEAARYEVHVVSREPTRAIPFTLVLTY